LKQKSLFLTLGLLLVAVGGYFTYNHFVNRPVVLPWDVVPTETVLVYESSGCQECLQRFENSSVASIIKAAAFISGNDTLP